MIRARSVMLVVLVLLGGCGSCLDDKKVPEVDGPPTIKTVTKTTELGKRPILVGDGVRFSDHAKRDGGSDGRR